MDMEDYYDKIKPFLKLVEFGFIALAGYSIYYLTDYFFSNYPKSIVKETRIEYVNEDSLPDLVNPDVGTFLQKKDGTFQSIDDYLKEKKETEMDSLKNVYELKIKGVYKRCD